MKIFKYIYSVFFIVITFFYVLTFFEFMRDHTIFVLVKIFQFASLLLAIFCNIYAGKVAAERQNTQLTVFKVISIIVAVISVEMIVITSGFLRNFQDNMGPIVNIVISGSALVGMFALPVLGVVCTVMLFMFTIQNEKRNLLE